MKNQTLNQKQARSIAIEQAIKILSVEKESFRDRLTGTDDLGNNLADRFDDSDESQDKYNDSLSLIQDEFDKVINRLTEELVEIGQFGSKSNP